ncbi:hypothetical protein C8Q75DRAFT_748053 [Abortiporus biennis]|nr:hypothetical protein C8Q75DRAFT_748053 [Abortiporus biennis]
MMLPLLLQHFALRVSLRPTTLRLGNGLLQQHAAAATAFSRTFLTSASDASPVKTAAAAKGADAIPKTKKVAAKKAKTTKSTKSKPAVKRTTAAKKSVPKRKPKKAPVVKLGKRISPDDRPPKKPVSSYLLFWSDFIKSRPTSTSVEETRQLVKQAGEEWRNLDPAKKIEYQEKYKAAFVEYRELRGDYARNITPETLSRINKIRVNAGKPKYRFSEIKDRTRLRKPNPFNKFISSEAGSRPEGTSVPEYFRELASRWNALSEAEKEAYRSH